jgi:hypothetical protein
MSKNVIFMIEGGKALEMVKQHIAERRRAAEEVALLAQELGIKEGMTNRTNGILTGVIFTEVVHPDFTKPKKRNGASYPKKGTEWAKRFAAQHGYRDPACWIAEEFRIPTTIKYSKPGAGFGSYRIGSLLTECGFLFLSDEGPYAMWVPDVPAYVAQYSEDEWSVDEPAASFKLEFDGCRRIEDEEWKILVLQRKLAQKQAA